MTGRGGAVAPISAMWLWQVGLALAVLTVAGTDGSPLDDEADAYLSGWYEERLRVKLGLGEVSYEWLTGWLWWKKIFIVRCPFGVVDFTQSNFTRIGTTQASAVNTTRPWVLTSLQAVGRVTYYNCSTTGSAVESNWTLSGKVKAVREGDLQLMWTYVEKDLLWCTVSTLDARLGERGVALEDFQTTEAPIASGGVDGLAKVAFARVRQATDSAWATLVGQGPTAVYPHCKYT